MDWVLFFAGLATLINILVALGTFWNIRQKRAAEQHLLKLLLWKSADPSFFKHVEEAFYSLQKFPRHRKPVVKGAQKLMLPLIQKLDQPYKKLLLETLYQPSEIGQAQYTLKLLSKLHDHAHPADTEPTPGMSPTTA